MEIDLTDNELIAEFLGWKPDKVHGQKGAWKPTAATPEFIGLYSLRLFEESWDWLMPVVEKIEGLGHKIIISNTHGQYCNIMYGVNLAETSDTKAMGVGETKIEAVYKAVVAFIQWYNQNRKQ